ncbi:hypothetical protein IQ265_07815 [Nodosilinea sp. LEGE 06152]|uniref:hypothetical protein n=1 Tax=Nodosilinea sp. LEGE 06152 TaxID=2777966 RepID=UPI00188258D8|nr:hypothetical protein [Nodosilinea sp. LEGE 06152]MBE9156733.1 hypothetical protein [Nodosilinea sp. LEGE 06152]
MDKIKEQANVVSQLLFSADTSEIYKKALARTWDILREVGILLWLVICLTFVGGEWFYRTAVGLGRSTRAWYVGLSEKDSTADAQPITSTGQALLDTVQSGTSYLLAQARQQLGIPAPEPLAPVAAPAPAPAPSAPTPVEPPTPSGPPAPAEPLIASEPPPSPVATVSADIEDEDDDLA